MGLEMELELFAKAVRAHNNEESSLEFLHDILLQIQAVRLEKSIETMMRMSGIPVHKYIEDFDFSYQTSIDEKKVRDLTTLSFVHAHENVLLIGEPGVGKSHIAISLAEICIQKGMKAYFISMSDLVDKLRRAVKNDTVRRTLNTLCRPSLLVIDELGYQRLDQQTSEIFFQLVSRRYEQNSIVITSNFPISEWDQIFASPALAKVIADRLIHHSSVFKMSGESYRLRSKMAQ